ncbi:MAG: nucleotidyltransferase domain-containing protein [Candidatus Paceibacterota bacterium]|jgi:predicted nucleotidyltransferase
MSISEVKKIIKNYAKILKEKEYSFSSLYLFGSYAKGKAHKWSDIDVAVISSKSKINSFSEYKSLSRICLDVDYRIEPHCFSVKDFNDSSDPLVSEIKKTGIRVV